MKVSIAVDNINKQYGRGKVSTVTVEAEKTPCRGIALTKRVGLRGYVLTHVNTGQAIVTGDGEESRVRLLKIADKLAKIEFNFAAHKTVKELTEAVAKADPKVQAKIRAAVLEKQNKEKK